MANGLVRFKLPNSDLKAMLTAEKADAVSELRRSEGTSRSCGSMLRRARPGDVDLLRSMSCGAAPDFADLQPESDCA